MFQPFEGVVVNAIDGDSVWVNRDHVGHVKVRVGGVDVPSRGEEATMAKTLIDREWANTRVRVRPTATYLVHGEIPAIVTALNDRTRNLGKELLEFGRRLVQFSIETGNTPPLTGLKL